jgi:hypothetical protein
VSRTHVERGHGIVFGTTEDAFKMIVHGVPHHDE